MLRSVCGRRLRSFVSTQAVLPSARPTFAQCAYAYRPAGEWNTRRLLHLTAPRWAEETPMMPFQQDIMNLLNNHEEFRSATFSFADRMQKLLGIDVNAGQMPSPNDMLTVAQDPELRDLSMKIATILQDCNINLSEDTLKQIWSSLGNRQ